MRLNLCTLDEGVTPLPPPVFRLKAVYDLETDPGYQITHSPMNGTLILLLNMDGLGKATVGHKGFSLAGSTCLLFSPQEVFDYWCDGKTWSFWWFEFDCLSSPLPMELMVKQPYQMKPLMLDLCRSSLHFLQQGKLELASSMFTSLFCLVAANVSNEKNGVIHTEFYDKIIEYIDLHPTVDVGELTRQFDVSERTLRNMFHRYLNMSPKEFIQSRKMERARYMLKNTMKQISEISDSLGYTNQFQFSRSFKNETGLSPLAYRKQ